MAMISQGDFVIMTFDQMDEFDVLSNVSVNRNTVI